MTKINQHTVWMILLPLAFLFVAGLSQAQTNSANTLSRADTSNFSPNSRDGWKLFNSYLARVSEDSVRFELILQHDRSGIDWSQSQYIGRIKEDSLIPARTTNIERLMRFSKYELEIQSNGKCYLRLVDGSIPVNDPVVIPVKTSFLVE